MRTGSLVVSLFVLLFSLPALATEHQRNHGHNGHDQGSDHVKERQAKDTNFSSTLFKEILNSEFSLINSEGNTITNADFPNKYLLVGFGFTHCRHVCPTLMVQWKMLLRHLPEAQANLIQPILITLDPSRDTPQVMQDYVEKFDKSFIGLSGTQAQVSEAAENFKVTYDKVGDADYQINHTSLTFLVAPNGDVINFYGFGTQASQAAKSLSASMLQRGG